MLHFFGNRGLSDRQRGTSREEKKGRESNFRALAICPPDSVAALVEILLSRAEREEKEGGKSLTANNVA